MSNQSNATNAAEFTVSEISHAVKASIEDQFGYVRVRGELGRVSRPASGHVYLDLKDEKAVLSGVIWRGAAMKMSVKPEQGLEVIATGKLTTFPGQSKYQMIIDRLEPAGAGALMALLEERKKKLAAEGLFAIERKKKLPYLPGVIGVVTSPSGAVIRDILHRVKDRFPVHVLVWPVRVQGETCADEVAVGVRGFNDLPAGGPIPRPDLIIVARGGGSLEDLWGFNEEAPARAVAESVIPVISAVGHETDVTLIDYVADLRAPTPTGAAELALPVRSELIATLGDLDLRQYGALTRLMERRRADLRSAARALPQPRDILGQARQRFDLVSGRLEQGLVTSTRGQRARLEMAAGRLRHGLVGERIAAQKQRLGDLEGRLQRGLVANAEIRRGKLDNVASRLRPALVADRMALQKERLADRGERLRRVSLLTVEQKRAQLAGASRLLESLSHKGVLARGFALVRDRDGKPMRRAQDIDPGQSLDLEFADGFLHATASLIDTYEPPIGDTEPRMAIDEAQAGPDNGGFGIMGAEDISPEDIEANLRSIVGKKVRRRIARPTKAKLDKPPTEAASDKPAEGAAPELLTSESLEEARAKLTESIEQEIMARLKEQLKTSRKRKKSDEGGTQGSLF